MLVLQRMVDESVMIGDAIEITIVAIRGRNAVRIGIDAPKNLPVHRKEVWRTIKREREAKVVK